MYSPARFRVASEYTEVFSCGADLCADLCADVFLVVHCKERRLGWPIVDRNTD